MKQIYKCFERMLNVSHVKKIASASDARSVSFAFAFDGAATLSTTTTSITTLSITIPIIKTHSIAAQHAVTLQSIFN